MIFAGCLVTGASVFAQAGETDSLKVVNLQEVQAVSTRATLKAPVTFTNVSKEELRKRNFGRDIPYLPSMIPSALTASDAEADIGCTTLRVRGTGGTRINITANGTPANGAESHTLLWVNVPDFTSSVKDIQMQRGMGTSANGTGTFGASVNIQAGGISMRPYTELNAPYGTFNAHGETVKFDTGLLNGHWAFDAHLPNIGTDGYIDRASVDLYSFYAQGGYFTDNTSMKFIIFGGKEKTYRAWNCASKEEVEKYGRRFNSCGMYTGDDDNIRFYRDQTDNYLQMDYQLLLNHTFSPEWSLGTALHYTERDGYYQKYKENRTLREYHLPPFMHDGKEVDKSGLIRRKKMGNHFGDGVLSVNYQNGRLNVSLGGTLNHYGGWHFGQVIWVGNYIGGLFPDHEYYRNKAKKIDDNLYLEANYNLVAGLNAYAGLQYRYISYKISGDNDKFDYNTDTLQKLAVSDHFNFFNPKAGLSWGIDANNQVYASFPIAQKEPTRNNYTDGNADEYPKAEKLLDYELGYTYRNTQLSAGTSFYYMDYKNQLVLTGELSKIGETIAHSTSNSYRIGVELILGVKPCQWFQWDINGALSKNRVKNFTEKLYEDEWKNPIEISHGDTSIAFSPDLALNNRFSFSCRGFEAALQSQYIGKQYMSNARQVDQTLDTYFVSNLSLTYTFKLLHMKSVTAGFTIYNPFNAEHENNGYAGSGYKIVKGEVERYDYTGYAAQAGTNVMSNISIRF